MKKSVSIRILAIFVVYLFLELLAFVGLKVVRELTGPPPPPNISELSQRQVESLTKVLNGTARYRKQMKPDPVLGWRPVIEANSAGMRDQKEYMVEPEENVLRIAAFGDSFTYGSDVALEDSWGQQLAKLNPSIQLFNFGSGAYGLDQAFLSYKKNKRPYKANIVLLGYMSENLARNVNVFRPFYHPTSNAVFTKPRFKLVDNELVLLRNPVSSKDEQREFLEHHKQILPELGENDYHFQVGYSRGPLDFSPLVRLSKEFVSKIKKQILMPIFTISGMYSTRSEAFELTKRIFDEFYREVLTDGSLPVILIFPETSDQRRSRAGKTRRYQPLITYLDLAGYPYIDILDAVAPYEPTHSMRDLTVQWGHFSPLGNQIIAEYIEQYLIEHYSLDVKKVSLAIERERERLGISN